ERATGATAATAEGAELLLGADAAAPAVHGDAKAALRRGALGVGGPAVGRGAGEGGDDRRAGAEDGRRRAAEDDAEPGQAAAGRDRADGPGGGALPPSEGGAGRIRQAARPGRGDAGGAGGAVAVLARVRPAARRPVQVVRAAALRGPRRDPAGRAADCRGP